MQEKQNKITESVDYIKNNLDKYTSEALCSIVVTDRYLNYNQELQVVCLQELMARRLKGEDFKFEEFIDTELKKLPKISYDLGNVFSIIESAKNMKK